MTSQVLASHENAYSLATPRRLVEKRLTSPLGNVLHSTPVSCYCPHIGYSNCQCGLTPEVRQTFVDSFHEPMHTTMSRYDNTIEPTVQWHRAVGQPLRVDSRPDMTLVDFSYRTHEDTPSGMVRVDMTTSHVSPSQTSPKAACEPSSDEQDSSNSSEVIL